MKNRTQTSPTTAPFTSTRARLHKAWKIWFYASMCTLIANILCLPLWTDYDVVGLIRTPFNKVGRMEIIYTGSLTGAEAFSVTSSDPSLDTTPTNYSYGQGAQLYRVDLPIEGEWKPYKLTLHVRRKGNMRIRLRGPCKLNDYGEMYSIASDYRNLKIGNKEIFSEQRKVTHARDFSYHVPVNANDAINVSFDVRRHHFDANDLNLGETKNYWYIVTLSVLTFVIFYILLQRLSITCKYAKAEDAVFLSIFFLLLVIPLSDISDAQVAVREGRALKRRPKIQLALKQSISFGKEFDGWFCDHLGGREWLIKLHDVIQRETQEIIRRQRGWYIQDSGWLFEDLRLRSSSKDLHLIVKALVDLEKFCEMNRIKLYVLSVPRKESIYQELLYGYGMDKERGAAEKDFHEQIKLLAGRQHVTYIYPWTELREASKRDYTFFKLVHHWTDWGAYTGYRALMKEIRRDFPDMPIVSLENYRLTRSCLIRDSWDRSFSTGNLGKLFNFETDYRCPATIYDYYDCENAGNLLVDIGKYTKEFRYGGGGIQNDGDRYLSN